MRLKFQVATLLLIFSTVACQTKEEPETREAALRKGFAMMDEGKSSEAINYFAELAERDSHFHVKIAWASAYAHRAGLRIEKIYSFTALSPRTQDFSLPMNGLSFDQKTTVLLQNIQSFLSRWERIPTLNASARSDLQSAVQILSQETEPGARLYSAILRVVLLKSVSQEANVNWSALQSQTVCGKQLKSFYSWAVQVLEQLSVLSEDLEIAFPKEAQNYREIKNKTRDLQTAALKWKKPAEDECYSLARD